VRQRELVVLARQGDVEAFSILAGHAVDRLHAVAFRILRDADQADDATQQSLIEAWDHIRSLRDPDRFDAWTYRLVVNASYRVAKRERVLAGRVRLLPAPSPSDADPTSRVADRDQLERAFRSLSPEHRAVLVLHHYADLPLAEIAEILGIPIGTVGSRLHHAARRLRAALDEDAQVVLARGQAV